jgi:isopenicillin N synthase-like dioxygenase
MKISDDYRAKIRLWAAQPTVMPLPAAPRLPAFRARRFRSHEEMNRWKRSLLQELARSLALHG